MLPFLQNRKPRQIEGSRSARALGPITVVGFLVVLWSGTSFATTWTVKKDGTGDAMVIQDAVDMAAPGDTVLIHPGRYLEYAPYSYGALTADSYAFVDIPNLTIRGTDRDAVILGEPSYIWSSGTEPVGIGNVDGAEGLRVENLTVENMVQGVVLNADGLVSGCTLRGNDLGVVNWGPSISRCENSLFESCNFQGVAVWNTADSFQLLGCSFLARDCEVIMSHGQDVLVDSCDFDDRSFVKFQMQSLGAIRSCAFTNGARIYALGVSQVTIEDNFVGAGPFLAMQVSDSSEVIARRNIFEGSDLATILVFAGCSVLFENNHILHGLGPSVEVQYFGASGFELDFRNNWWGTTDSTQIAEWILDAVDEPSRGETVDFWPIRDRPLPTQRESVGGLKARFGGGN